MPKVKTEISSRLGMCLICKETEAKYRCPECEIVTCSLPCIKQHKKQFNCSGIRNKTEFVPIKKMNELHLLSDYRLLEELSRVTDACTRDDSKNSSRKNCLPYYLQKFRKAASQRQCRAYFLPKNFSRHKNNTTILNWKTQRICWKLDVVFLHAQKKSITVDRCPEDTILDVVIEKCLKAAVERNKAHKNHFEAYRHSKTDIQVLMQTEKVPEAHNKFYVLDNQKSLRENLIGKRIVEFPVFYVVLKGFYSSQALSSVSDSGDVKTKTKLDSLLISNYSLANTESPSSDEEGEKSNLDGTSAIKIENPASEDESSDEDCLDESKFKDILGNLYKQAEQAANQNCSYHSGS